MNYAFFFNAKKIANPAILKKIACLILNPVAIISYTVIAINANAKITRKFNFMSYQLIFENSVLVMTKVSKTSTSEINLAVKIPVN